MTRLTDRRSSVRKAGRPANARLHGQARRVPRSPPALGAGRLGSRSSLAALPLASKQTEHLTGGGFDVPGSESQGGQRRAAGGFRDEDRRDHSAAAGRPGRRCASPGRRRRPGPPRCRRPRRSDAAARRRPARRAGPAAHRHGAAAAAQRAVPRPADRLRHDPARRARSRRCQRRRHHLPRRAADDLGGDAGALQGRPRESRGRRLPDRRDHPARSSSARSPRRRCRWRWASSA